MLMDKYAYFRVNKVYSSYKKNGTGRLNSKIIKITYFLNYKFNFKVLKCAFFS